jgi:hypothetical protein
VNELDALESDDLIPADNADSCHSSADEPKAVSNPEAAFSFPPRGRGLNAHGHTRCHSVRTGSASVSFEGRMVTGCEFVRFAIASTG